MTDVERPKLMISYSRVDLEFVLKVFEDLKRAGIHAWLDQIDIPAGANWDLEIEAALEAASTLLVVISQHSRKSDNVKNEISHALELGKNVVPIILDKSPAPLLITRLQREDFTGSYENALERLIVRLKRSGRTEAFEAISEEAVQRAARDSAERISNEGEVVDASVAVGREPELMTQAHRHASLEPVTRQAVSTSAIERARGRGRSKSLLYGLSGGGAVAVAAAVAIWMSASDGATNSASAAAAKQATEVVAPQVKGVPSAGPVTAVNVMTQPAPMGSGVGTLTPPKPNVSNPSKQPDPALGAPLPQPTSGDAKAPLSESTTLPNELIGSWGQSCNPAAAMSPLVEAVLTFTATSAETRIHEYPGQTCGRGQPAGVIHEVLDVKQVKKFEGGVYRIDFAVRRVSLTPSLLTAEWSRNDHLGKKEWNYVETSVLGELSEPYFGYPLEASNMIYATFRLLDGKLQYLPAREAGNSPETRPAISELSTRYWASRRGGSR